MEVGIFDILLLFSSLAISLAVVVPLAGVLVRFRANYNPKSLQLDPEDGPQPHAGPIINSYFGMFKRVYQLERLSGLYKGFMPTFLSTTAVTLVLLLAMDDPKPRHGRYSAPDTGVFGTLFYGILMSLIGLPTVILTYRSTTTPQKLPWLNLMQSLRVLLTPTERRRPWVLYLTPGLLAAEISHVGYVTLVLGTLRRLLLPALSKPGIPTPSDFPPLRTIIYISVVVVSTIILTPLEVISTRLAIQRNHALSGNNSVSQEVDGDAEDLPEYSPEEDVIGLRNEEDPYIGIVDCAQRILQEEGLRALYRAWWITMLGGLAAAFT
ncbi:mitochondrial carrier [Pleurotus eryngii]|uniref:Mitochondrial carrier n=1 Tax=Pleurotus eryngii TaxID=5323 RepID=A0A9P6ABW8_PLEER|nr:mitochondrial carrier [Pleurotus eryngii]